MPTDLSFPYGNNDRFNDITSYNDEHGYLTNLRSADDMMCEFGITVSPRELHREFTPVFEESSVLAAIPSTSTYLQDEYSFAAELFRDNTPLSRDNSPYPMLPPPSAVTQHPLEQLADSVPGLIFDPSTGLVDGSFDVLTAAALMSSPDHDMSVPEIFQWMEEYSKRKLSNSGLRIINGLLDGAHNVLVFAVLLLAPSQQMKLKDIYAAIKKNTTKRQAKNSSGWQNGVRHNLSMNKVSTGEDLRNRRRMLTSHRLLSKVVASFSKMTTTSAITGGTSPRVHSNLESSLLLAIAGAPKLMPMQPMMTVMMTMRTTTTVASKR